jgi:prepilin-type N-terminal cleavage/methylation domain-containing protein
MRRLKLNQKGFTLPELIVTMTLMMILSLTLANFVVNWFGTASLAQARADLLTNAENALDTITNDIRLSGSADDTNRWPDANSPGGQQFGWHSGTQVLVLAKAATDASNNIIFSDPAQYITQKDNVVYYLSNGTLYKRTIAADDASSAAVTTCPPAGASQSCPADKTIATGVKGFTITYYDENLQSVTPDNARAVQLAITLSATKGGRTVDANYNTRMVFRNE